MNTLKPFKRWGRQWSWNQATRYFGLLRVGCSTAQLVYKDVISFLRPVGGTTLSNIKSLPLYCTVRWTADSSFCRICICVIAVNRFALQPQLYLTWATASALLLMWFFGYTKPSDRAQLSAWAIWISCELQQHVAHAQNPPRVLHQSVKQHMAWLPLRCFININDTFCDNLCKKSSWFTWPWRLFSCLKSVL